MPEITTAYAAGTPCWVSLNVPDQRAALDFYRDLFGWAGQPGPEERGGYSVCTWHGRPVAGIGTAPERGDRPVSATTWTTFLACDDADAAALAVGRGGGRLLTDVRKAPAAAEMFVAADPTGAVFGMWRALDLPGALVVNEPSTMAWNELNCTDPQAAAAFYPTVVDATVTPYRQMPGYFTLNVNGRPVGGIQGLGDDFPPGTPSHWLVYFSVDDTDSSVDAVVKAGGSVLAAPFDMPAGRMAVVTDPQGGVFAMIAQLPSA